MTENLKSYKLKESDLQNLRTGLPVKFAGDFYPSISGFIKQNISSDTAKHFTKLIIASFGDGKSTLCNAMEREWLNAGFAVSSIYIHNEAKLNDLHVNLIKALKTKDKDFFQLLASIAKDSGSASKNHIIRWAHDNHDNLIQIIDWPEFREGFWDWFENERIAKFSKYLTSQGIAPFPSKNSPNEARRFLYDFCNALTKNKLRPFLIIDELESIASFRSTLSAKKVTTQLREIIDKTSGNYSLAITSTEAFFRDFASDYRAVHERLYNGPSTSAKATTWHLAHLRDENAVKDFFKLIKKSNPDWHIICDNDTSALIDLIIPEGDVGQLDLRMSVRQFIIRLDESVFDGKYHAYILQGRKSPATEAEIELAALQNANEQYSSADASLEAEGQIVSDCDSGFNDDSIDSFAVGEEPYYGSTSISTKSTFKISSFINDMVDSLKFIAGSRSSNQTIKEIQDDRYFVPAIYDAEVHKSQPAKQGAFNTIKADPLAPCLQDSPDNENQNTNDEANSGSTKKRNHSVEVFSKLTQRGSSHTIESLATLIAKARDIPRLRVVTEATALTSVAAYAATQDGFIYKTVPFGSEHSGYSATLIQNINHVDYLVIKPRNEPKRHWLAHHLEALSQHESLNSISEVRRLVYMLLIMSSSFADDVYIDEMTVRTVSQMGGAPAEARDGPLFVRSIERRGLTHQADDQKTKTTRYRDRIEHFTDKDLSVLF